MSLKNDGWRVFATARTKKDIERLKATGVESVYMDYAIEKSIHSAFEDVMKAGDGRLDALFNNGAYGQPGAVEDLPTDALRQQFEANFFGWHTLTNRVVPVMRKQGYGRIIHCSSVLGFVPMVWRGAYNASKYALEGLATTMRLELSDSGIDVCLIEPGPIKSEFSANGIAHFFKNIKPENSIHAKAYEKQIARLGSKGGKNRFRLGPDAVYKCLDHALNAKRPKAYYLVTVPTYFMAFARRFLPYSWLEKLLKRSTN